MDLREHIDQSYRASVAGMDIPWMLGQWAEKQPEKICLIWRPFTGEQQSWTYRELFDAARRLAAGLKNRGVNTGDFVFIHMDNSPEFIISWYGCAMLGAVAVSTNTRCVARDLSYFEEVVEPVCALTQPKYAELIRASCSHLRFIAVTDTDSGEPREDVGEIISSIDAIPFDELPGNKPIDLSRPDPARNLSVQFTSGTTSRPKAVLWTHGNGIWAGKTSAQHYRLREDDITLIYMPLFHTNAQGYSMLSTHWSGGTIVVQPKFSASRYWQMIMEHNVTWASMIPFAIKAIAGQPVPDHKMRLWSLGARVPEMEAMFGVPTLGLWGMTETLTQGTVADPDHLGPPGTIGRAAPGYEIELRRPDGSLCGPGEQGHLYIRGVRGVSLFKEYYRNLEANESSFDENGFFDTGDIVRSDEDGWLYFCDRDKDMLKVGVENVAASEIEAVVMQTGLVGECAVVGQKHHMLDEVPVVFVIPSPTGAELGSDELEQKIIEHCRVNLPDFKVVRSVHVVEELPRSTLEKIAKNVLRDRLPAIEE